MDARIRFEQIKMAPFQELIKERQSREVDIAKVKLESIPAKAKRLSGFEGQNAPDYRGYKPFEL